MSIPAYASLLRYNVPEVVSDRASAAMEQGFQQIKLHEHEEDEMRAAREAVGSGISEMRKIITLAETQGGTVMPHSPYFGPGLLATLHILATLPDECLAEFFFYKSLPASLYGDAIITHDGHMSVPCGPGLGVEPDLDVIKEYAVHD